MFEVITEAAETPLRNFGMQTTKVGFVFFGENVHVNTWPSYLAERRGQACAL
jgi:hypothetical protein